MLARVVTGRRDVARALATLPIAALVGCDRAPAAAGPARRLVTLGGQVTEIVHALGAFAELVGVDSSSVYPEAAKRLPRVGYHRRFSAEGVIGLRPTHVLLTDQAGPARSVEQLKAAGVNLTSVTAALTIEAAYERMAKLGRALDLETRAGQLARTLDSELESARRLVRRAEKRPRVVFIYTRGRGVTSVAGRGTGAELMIRLAGGDGALFPFEGFRPLTAEGLVQAAPDVLLFTARGHADLGGDASAANIPGVALTPAGQNRRFVVLDDLLLMGFGPRTGQGVTALARALHPELAAPEASSSVQARGP